MRSMMAILLTGLLALLTTQMRAQGPAQPDQRSRAGETWKKIAFAFQPPPALAGNLGHYRSPLLFDDGRAGQIHKGDGITAPNDLCVGCLPCRH